MKKITKLTLATCLALGISVYGFAQPKLTHPQSSQKAMTGQVIGLTMMKVVYHSPQVKGRDIWGALVPYEQIWRAGANKNTTVYFSTDVKVQGKELKAGTYGLHMIPKKEMWTVIFSLDHSSWGSFFYDKSSDAIRVEVKPGEATMQEWLGFTFDNRSSDAVDLVMHWEKLKVPVHIEVDLKTTVYASMEEELHGLAGFSWEGPYEAAQFCLNKDFNLEEAMVMIDKSIARQENFNNLRVKSLLLKKEGNESESNSTMEAAMKMANETQMNAYGYQLMNNDDLKGAIAIFMTNVEKHPDSWNVYDSLAEALAKDGNKKGAKENYKKALSMAPDGQKKRITSAIEAL
jgi:Protein of unknown function (DUF2911)